MNKYKSTKPLQLKLFTCSFCQRVQSEDVLDH